MTEDNNNKKRVLYCVIAILLALLAYSVAQSAQDTADINNVFVVVVNNTNLAPTIHPSIPGTGERVSGNTYWANTSPIELFVLAHAATSGNTAEIHLFINGTKVSDTSGRPLGAAEESNKTIVAIIPKGSNYSVDFTNTHHYEWREYPILSGKNGTLSVNTSVSDTQLNLKVNKSGDNMTGQLIIDRGNLDGAQFNNGAFFVRNYRSYFYANNESYAFAFGYNHSEFNAGHLLYLGATRNVANFGGVTSPDMQFSNSGGNPILVINGTTANITAYDNASFPASKGVVLKSPDGTKCGILTWTNADTLASTSTTCP